MLSIIIPARNEQYLQKTIDSLLGAAKEAIEIIVVLDGYWPNPPLKDDDRVIIMHRGESRGMRHAINAAAEIAHGKYIMKTDAHCLWADGFDVALKADCAENWVAVPSRYSLDVTTWQRRTDKRLPVEYDYITYPYSNDEQFGMGLHGKKWTLGNLGYHSYYDREIRLKDKKIDDVISIQGSAWFMHKSHFFNIGCLDEVHSYNIYQEAQEIVFKTWLSGGRVTVNKNTWYAHWHKTDRGFKLSREAKHESERFCTWLWMNDKWPKSIRTFKWLVDRFSPMPGWPLDWQPRDDNHFRVFDEKGHDGYR